MTAPGVPSPSPAVPETLLGMAKTGAPALSESLHQTIPVERLVTLSPLTEALAKSVTCPICLEYMEKARQLQCGHLFCAECVVRMLGMPKVRCAVCKQKTGKRMVRTAPLPFAQIVENLRLLESIVEDNKVGAQKSELAGLNDGFGAVISTTLERLERARKARLHPSPPSETGTDTEVRRAPACCACALCPKNVDPSSFGDDVYFGQLKPVSSDMKKEHLFAHEECALYSTAVYEMDGQFENVDLILSMTRKVTCCRSGCGRANPNVHCAYEGCKKQFHFPCAVVEGCTLIEDGYKMFCVEHKDHAPKIEDEEFIRRLSDPRGRESLEHDNACYLCNSGGRLLMCDSCNRVTHPVCSGLKGIPLGDWSCGVCTGVHKHPLQVSVTPQSNSRTGTIDSSKRKRMNGTCTADTLENEQCVEEVQEPIGRNKRSRKAGDGAKRYVISHTRLRNSQRELLRGIAKNKKAILKSDVEPRVTHLVIGAYRPEDNPTRTMKLCKAIACKTPIVCWKWVEESAQAGKAWAAVEGHLHPLTWKKEVPSVFEGLVFYFGCYNGAKDKKEELMRLVQLGGGTISHRDPILESRSAQEALFYVRDEEGEKSGHRESLARFEPPAGAKIILSGELLDKCTKDRL